VAGSRCPGVDLGSIAFVRDGALAVVDLRNCRTRVLVPANVVGPLQFSADGRYIAFGGGFVPTGGGPVRRTPAPGVWSPKAELLVTPTARGGAQLFSPDGTMQRLIPDGWGASSFAFSPDGVSLAVSRSLFPKGRPPYHQEIWLFDLKSGARRKLFRVRGDAPASPKLAAFSPSGRWLVFWEEIGASLDADGAPLLAVPVAGGRAVLISPRQLIYRDFMTWCGNRLVFVLNHGGRQVTLGDGIAATAPPQWHVQTILRAGGRTSWNSVACPAAQGREKLVVAGGPSSGDSPFGHEHRSLWLLHPRRGAKPALLSHTVPPAGETDELPMWSRDGRWILFVRTKGAGAVGKLYAIDPVRDKLVGPITGVGRTGNYYGAYGWSNQIDWHR
jgi:dipeptidyl aminopeptidase/acylaminoacyl peptidase